MQIVGDSAGNPPADATIFRVLQECLSNIGRHAEARQAEIRLERSAEGIRLTVADDGRGFDRDRRQGGGIGLINMQERADLAGGRLTIESVPDSGCRVTLVVPACEPMDG